MKTWVKLVGLFFSGLSATSALTYLLTEVNKEEAPAIVGPSIEPTVLSDQDKFIAKLASMKVLEGEFRFRVASSSVGCNLYGDTFKLTMPSLEDISFSLDGTFVGAGIANLPYHLNYNSGSLYASIDVFKWTLDTNFFNAIGDFLEMIGMSMPSFELPTWLTTYISNAMLGWVNDMTVSKNVGSIDYTLAVPFVKIVLHSDLDYNFTGFELKPFDYDDFTISFDFDVTCFSTVLEEEDVIEAPSDAETYIPYQPNMGVLSLVKAAQGELTTDKGLDFDIKVNGSSINSNVKGTLGYDSALTRFLMTTDLENSDLDLDISMGESIDYYASYDDRDEDDPLRVKGSLVPSGESTSLDINEVVNQLNSLLESEKDGLMGYLFGGLNYLGLNDLLPNVLSTLTNSTLSLATSWKIISFLQTKPLTGIDIVDGRLTFYMNNNLLGLEDGSFALNLGYSQKYGLIFNISDLEYGGLNLELTLHNAIAEDFEEFTDLKSLAESPDPEVSESFLNVDQLTEMSYLADVSNIGFDYSLQLSLGMENQGRDEEGNLTDFTLGGVMSGSINASWEDNISFYLDGSIDDEYGYNHHIAAYLEGENIESSRALVRYANSSALLDGSIGLTDEVTHLSGMFDMITAHSNGVAKTYSGVLGKLMDRVDYFMTLFGASPAEFDYEAFFNTAYLHDFYYQNGDLVLELDRSFLDSEEEVLIRLSLTDKGIESLKIENLKLYAEGENSLEMSFSLDLQEFDETEKLIYDESYLDLSTLDLEQLFGQTDLNLGISGSFYNEAGELDSSLNASVCASLEKGLFYGAMDISAKDNAYNGMPVSHHLAFDKADDTNILFSYQEEINGTARGKTNGYFTTDTVSSLSSVLSSMIVAADNDRFSQYFSLFFSDNEPWMMKLLPLVADVIEGTAVASDYCSIVEEALNASENGPIIRGLNYDGSTLKFTLDKSFMSVLKDLVISVKLEGASMSDTNPFRIASLSIENFYMNGCNGTITINNLDSDYTYTFDESAHPLTLDDSYYDLTSSPDLLAYLMKTAECDFFKINGEVALDLEVIGFIPLNWDGITVNANVWIDEDEKVYAYVVIDKIPSTILNQEATSSEEKTCEIFYDSSESELLDGTIYMHNMEPHDEYKFPWWYPGVTHRYAKLTVANFGENAMFYLCKFMLNFGDTIYNAIIGAIDDHAERTEPICYSELITSFTYDPSTNNWTIGLNFEDLSNNEDCQLLDITLGSDSKEIIDKLSVHLGVDVSGALTVDLYVDAKMSVGDLAEAKSSSAYARFNEYMASSHGRSAAFTEGTNYESEFIWD